MHKLYYSSGIKIISKFLSKILRKILSKEKAERYENFKVLIEGIIEKIGRKYLVILVFINVILILFYISMIIYANVELSNNLDAYIDVHLKMKKGFIMLLLVKPNFIVNNKNKMEKFKYFNVWSKLQYKKKKGDMWDLDLEGYNKITELYEIGLGSKSDYQNLELGIESVRGEKGKEEGDSVENKNQDQNRSDDIENKINKMSSLSENLVNKKIVLGEIESNGNGFIKRSLGIDIKMVDEQFKKIIIYLKISSSYITKKNYYGIVDSLVYNLSVLGVYTGYLNEIKELLKKEKINMKGKKSNRNLEDNPIFNKYFDIYLELSNLCEKKNVKINLSIWDDFIQELENSEKFNHIELRKINEKIITNVKERYKEFGESNYYKEVAVGKRKRRRKSEDNIETVKIY